MKKKPFFLTALGVIGLSFISISSYSLTAKPVDRIRDIPFDCPQSEIIPKSIIIHAGDTQFTDMRGNKWKVYLINNNKEGDLEIEDTDKLGLGKGAQVGFAESPYLHCEYSIISKDGNEDSVVLGLIQSGQTPGFTHVVKCHSNEHTSAKCDVSKENPS